MFTRSATDNTISPPRTTIHLMTDKKPSSPLCVQKISSSTKRICEIKPLAMEEGKGKKHFSETPCKVIPERKKQYPSRESQIFAPPSPLLQQESPRLGNSSERVWNSVFQRGSVSRAPTVLKTSLIPFFNGWDSTPFKLSYKTIERPRSSESQLTNIKKKVLLNQDSSAIQAIFNRTLPVAQEQKTGVKKYPQLSFKRSNSSRVVHLGIPGKEVVGYTSRSWPQGAKV